MKSKEDMLWESLLVQAAPTFAVDEAPPFGLATRVLASLREQNQQAAAWDRVGRRAIFASLAAVVALAALTLIRAGHDDAEAPVKSLALVENVQVS